ncbi:hypothetical protein T05_6207 [Trichinella murrelli]|uniref:Uncharacterized protein n=1 Tax=Trichinella murrelli TaxID=144512 RepID=A0A0V0UA87_9BILA|nr:hypothetical protein T05_6207 [Trichinella murrelli]
MYTIKYSKFHSKLHLREALFITEEHYVLMNGKLLSEVLVAIDKRFEFSRHCTAGMLGGQGEVPVALKQLFNLLSIASCATWLATSFASSLGFIDLINIFVLMNYYSSDDRMRDHHNLLSMFIFCSVFELKKEKKEMLEMKDGCLKDAMESAVISILAFADRVLTMD